MKFLFTNTWVALLLFPCLWKLLFCCWFQNCLWFFDNFVLCWYNPSWQFDDYTVCWYNPFWQFRCTVCWITPLEFNLFKNIWAPWICAYSLPLEIEGFLAITSLSNLLVSSLSFLFASSWCIGSLDRVLWICRLYYCLYFMVFFYYWAILNGISLF